MFLCLTDYLFGRSANSGPVNPQDGQTETHPSKAQQGVFHFLFLNTLTTNIFYMNHC